MLADAELTAVVRNVAVLTAAVVVRSTGKPMRANLSPGQGIVIAIAALVA